MHKQSQSKYHRNNDGSISKTCVVPSRLDIFSVLSIGEFGESKENGEKSRRDKHIFGHPQKNNTSMVLGSGFWVLGLGPRKAQGPDLAPGPVKQTFL